MQQENKYESDSLQHPPSFDEMVGLIKNLFTNYLEDVMKTSPSEIGKAWERYKTLNHLYQDDAKHPAGCEWVKVDQKPEHNVGVLVFIPGEDNHITSGMWDISNEWVLLDEYRTPEEEVTHWMPIPAFPEGYAHDMLSDEWVSTLKAIAKEELSKRPSKEGNKVREVVAFAKYLDDQRNSETPEMWANKVIWDKPNAFQEWLQYFNQQNRNNEKR